MKRLSGKVILIDDQPVEKEILEIALERLNVHVDLVYFTSAIEALEYLKKTKDTIFIIICDMNMPKMNGLDLKRAIDADDHLKTKAVPFIFSSSGVTHKQLLEAYQYRLQGYFIKPMDVHELAKQLKTIINYWIISVRPDSDSIGTQDPIKTIV